MQDIMALAPSLAKLGPPPNVPTMPAGQPPSGIAGALPGPPSAMVGANPLQKFMQSMQLGPQAPQPSGMAQAMTGL